MSAEQLDLIDLIANDPRHDEEYEAFILACHTASRLGGGMVSINLVRYALSNDYGLVIEPRRYSGFWRRARLDGHLERTGDWETNTDARGRNVGKPQPCYRWVGAS